jgi:hypothetical protein
MRRLLAILLPALACAALLPATASAAPQTCPGTFAVLHDDAVGALQLPAGPYVITVSDPQKLSCSAAADFFRQFLEDFDGKLDGGWRVVARLSGFTRGGGVGFTVKAARPGTQPTGGAGSGRYPATGVTCPATFTVQHDDRIGPLRLPAGSYILTLLSVGRMNCGQAAQHLSDFLKDFDGRLPAPWIVDPVTGTFLAGSRDVGFRLDPAAAPPPSASKGLRITLPADGVPCPATFRVLHNDRTGALRLPAGPYLLVPLRGSGLACPDVVTLFQRFLAAGHDRLPSPWVVRRSTGTYTRGRGGDVGFRVKPL